MWENLNPTWGTGSFERFYNGPFKILLSTRPDDFDEWWEVNKECTKFIDDHIQYLSNPLYSITRDSTINLNSINLELEKFLKKRFPNTSNLLIDNIIIRLCEDLSVELSLHQLEIFGFINMALLDPLLQIDNVKIDIELLSSTVMELYYRELRFLLLIIHELASNCHPCVILGVLCDYESDINKNITQSPSNNYINNNDTNIFTSQCPPICVYGCNKILNSNFIKNAVNCIFQGIQEIIKLGQANIKTEPQSMIDISNNNEINNCLRDHYRNIIFQLTDTIAILFSRFIPTIEEVESLMELIPNVAKIHPSFLTNRPTAADYDSWDNIKDDSKEKLTLSAKILFIIIISFDYVPQRWKRNNNIISYPNSLYDSMNWFISSKRLPKSSKENLFLIKHPIISKLSQDYVNDFSKSLSLNDDINKPLINEFWDIDTPLGRFAAFAINGAFGENSKKRFMGITHWKIFHYIQNDLMPYLDPLDSVNLIFIQVIYDFYSVSLNPTQDPIQWSRILQLQRRILMERDSRQKVEKDRINLESEESINSILSPIICCLNVLCRRYPLASWGASKILSSCIEMFPTLSMYSSYGETDHNSSTTISMPPALSELFIDLLDLAATIMMVGHYSLGQQIAHFLQNQPSNIWFHLPSITQFITKTLSLRFTNNKREDDQLLSFENNYSYKDQPKLGIWSGSGLDRPQFFHSFCRAVLRILTYGFSTRLNISHPPPPPLLNLTIDLQGGNTISNFIIIMFRDWSENSILDDPKLAYALQSGCLDAFSHGLIHFQSFEILEIISNKINVFTKTIQYSINQNDAGVFLIKLLSCIIILQFKISNTNDLLSREIIELPRKVKISSTEINTNNCRYQLPILRWILFDILPLLDNQDIFPSVRYWTISTLLLKYIRFILSKPLPDDIYEFNDDSDAIIWLLRCILSIDSPTFHQLMKLIILNNEPYLTFIQNQNNDPSNKFKITTAIVGLDIIRILFQRDYIFINWVQYHKNKINQQYSNLLINNNNSIDQDKIIFDTEIIDLLSSTNSALIPFHEQLALPPSKIIKSIDISKNYFYRYMLLKYMIIGIDTSILKSIVFITYQLIYRDPESITALLIESPSLLLQLRSTITNILSTPTNDKFPVNIQKFISDNNDSFISIWNSPNSFISNEIDTSLKNISLISDQQAVFWEEITEIDTNSSLYSCDYNLLGSSCKTLIPIYSELENYWNLYLNALTESNDLSLWNKIKNLSKNETIISSTKLDISKSNEIILNGYLQSILPTFIPNRSCIYNKIARIHLTSTRSIILYTFVKSIEDKYIYNQNYNKKLDSVPTIIPLLLGLNLQIATDVPTINEYFLFSNTEFQNCSLKTYDEIYIPDSSSFNNDGTFPLLTIMDILAIPPQIPLSQPNEERLNHPCVDFAILTQLELYYLALRLLIDFLKIPQLIDYIMRLIINRLDSRYLILKEKILIPINWIPIEYRWLHYLHISMIINLISTEIFIISQVAIAIKIIEDSEIDNSLICDKFWLSSVQNLNIIFKIFLSPPKTSNSISDQFDILSVILNIGQAIIDDESDIEFEQYNEEIFKQTSLFNYFIGYPTSQNLVCGLYRTSYYSIFNDYKGNEKLYKEPFYIIFSNSIYTTCYHLFINEYVQFFGLLLNKYSCFLSSTQMDYDYKDMEICIYFTLQSIIELCRPYINYSFFKKTPIPLVTAILSIFSQTFLTILKKIYSCKLPNLQNHFNQEYNSKFNHSQSYISEFQKQKICFTTIQDCCEDIVHLLTELEKNTTNQFNSYFPFEWKNTLLLLLSNCIAIDTINIFDINQSHDNEHFTSSFLKYIWPEIWSLQKKNINDSSFIKFVTLLINNLRIPNFKYNLSIKNQLEFYLPKNIDSRNILWIIKPQELILLNYLKDKQKLNHQFNSFTFYPNMLIGIKMQENHSFLSLYLLFLIYNKIYQLKKYFNYKSSILVPCSNAEEHIQNLQALMDTSKLSNQSCIINLSFWNYITINWIHMSPIFLRKLIESNYLNYLLSQQILVKVLQDFTQFFTDFHIVSCENLLNSQFNKISNQLELMISIFSLIIEIINKGIIPKNSIAGYGSIDNFEIILDWIKKLQNFFNSFLEFFIKHLLFCQHKKNDWNSIVNKSSQLNTNQFKNQYIIEKFSPFLSIMYLLFSKILNTGIKIINLKDLLNNKINEKFNIDIDSNIIIINILHNRSLQIIEVISQMISTQINSNFSFSLLISCISWIEIESDFFNLLQEKYFIDGYLNNNFKSILLDDNWKNYDISTIIKIKYDIIKCLNNCNNNLFSSIKDIFEIKISNSKSIKQIQDIISILTRSNIIILNCYYNIYDKISIKNQIFLNNSFYVEDNYSEIIKNCINNLNLLLNIENKGNFINNRIPEIINNCSSELKILKNIKFKLENIVN